MRVGVIDSLTVNIILSVGSLQDHSELVKMSRLQLSYFLRKEKISMTSSRGLH